MEENAISLTDYLNQVQDKKTFLDFICALVREREDSIEKEKINLSNPYEANANGWENNTIESFFEAAIAWAADSGKMPETASWRAFAEFLYCGKIYE